MNMLHSRKVADFRGYWSQHLAPHTGPLNRIQQRPLVALLDIENLHHSAKDLGYCLDLATLALRLTQSSSACSLHACVSLFPDEHEQFHARYDARDWNLHVNPAEQVQTHRGIETKSNADALIHLTAGALFSRARKERVLLIGSGDGDLVLFIARFFKDRTIMTLSLPGSTSRRLNADETSLIHTNLEIGLDCLKPLF